MEVCQERFCSVVSQAVGEDPAGTAGSYDLLLLLEVPTPWEKEIWKSAGFPAGLFDLASAAQERGLNLRLLCIAPDPLYSQPGRRRAMILRRPPSLMARYEREEYLLPAEQVLDLAGAVFEGADLTPFAQHRVEVDGVRDLLVCTHGKMDAACGRYGYPVFERLREHAASERLRIWRISHFGGHRFAPTLLDLPEGRWWAHLDEAALDALVRRDQPVSALRRHYRGWGALPTAFEQVLEREAFEREGWPWLDLVKQSRVLQRCSEGSWAEVSLAFQGADGSGGGLYEGRVEVVHGLKSCLVSGKELEPVLQYSVTRLERRR